MDYNRSSKRNWVGMYSKRNKFYEKRGYYLIGNIKAMSDTYVHTTKSPHNILCYHSTISLFFSPSCWLLICLKWVLEHLWPLGDKISTQVSYKRPKNGILKLKKTNVEGFIPSKQKMARQALQSRKYFIKMVGMGLSCRSQQRPLEPSKKWDQGSYIFIASKSP